MIYNIIVDGFWKRPKFQLSAFQGLGFIIFDQCSPMKYRSEGLNPSSSDAPSTGLGNIIIVEYTIESDFNVLSSNGQEIELKQGQKVFIQFTHMDIVDESLVNKVVQVGDVLGQSGATGNPGFFDGSWGIPIEDRHIHLQVGTSHSNGFIPKASLIDPRIFILTQINENGLVEN